MKFQLKDFNILLLIGAILLVMFGITMNFVDIAYPTYYDFLINGTTAITFYTLALILILKTFKNQFQFAKFLYVVLSIPSIFFIVVSVIDIITRILRG